MIVTSRDFFRPECPETLRRKGGGRPNRWPVVCLTTGMSALTFRVNRKSGDLVKPALVPANHSEEPRFGLLDGAIVSFFLVSAGGLIYLLLQI